MGWIGIDLDGTLAEWKEPYDVLTIGAPIPAMVARVKGWLAELKDVRIVTSRVGPVTEEECRDALSEITTAQYVAVGLTDRDYLHVRDGDPLVFWYRYQRALIDGWCQVHLGRTLPVTATKDFHMTVLWDDRCVQVITNTGQTVQDTLAGYVNAQASSID